LRQFPDLSRIVSHFKFNDTFSCHSGGKLLQCAILTRPRSSDQCDEEDDKIDLKTTEVLDDGELHVCEDELEEDTVEVGAHTQLGSTSRGMLQVEKSFTYNNDCETATPEYNDHSPTTDNFTSSNSSDEPSYSTAASSSSRQQSPPNKGRKNRPESQKKVDARKRLQEHRQRWLKEVNGKKHHSSSSTSEMSDTNFSEVVCMETSPTTNSSFFSSPSSSPEQQPTNDNERSIGTSPAQYSFSEDQPLSIHEEEDEADEEADELDSLLLLKSPRINSPTSRKRTSSCLGSPAAPASSKNQKVQTNEASSKSMATSMSTEAATNGGQAVFTDFLSILASVAAQSPKIETLPGRSRTSPKRSCSSFDEDDEDRFERASELSKRSRKGVVVGSDDDHRKAAGLLERVASSSSACASKKSGGSKKGRPISSSRKRSEERIDSIFRRLLMNFQAKFEPLIAETNNKVTQTKKSSSKAKSGTATKQSKSKRTSPKCNSKKASRSAIAADIASARPGARSTVGYNARMGASSSSKNGVAHLTALDLMAMRSSARTLAPKVASPPQQQQAVASPPQQQRNVLPSLASLMSPNMAPQSKSPVASPPFTFSNFGTNNNMSSTMATTASALLSSSVFQTQQQQPGLAFPPTRMLSPAAQLLAVSAFATRSPIVLPSVNYNFQSLAAALQQQHQRSNDVDSPNASRAASVAALLTQNASPVCAGGNMHRPLSS
jgi:hypothetical protein